ncbi:methyltransferase domain-containing protein [Deinococcus taeanensis]|uniref:methyltransferase domain-containing protein n=1 Tax=Deinococcus taeanensis TaxID=2737050 RepID=UPI001CDC11AE|nr:methyltransferase domain-containing protein [Deinococcus taeanensis]UBV42867.1 methyltransferase domain-containing protein [Deinococcus taeanensis]
MTDDRGRMNERLFDAVAGSYDRVGFLAQAARFVARAAAVRPGERVLDVMTGTGAVAAEVAGVAGGVVGTDRSAGMLARARERLPGVTFVQADAATLPFPACSFDVAVCAAGVFFMPDMPGAAREWARVVRPGGRVVVSSFGPGLLGPLPGLWRAQLARVGLKPGAPPLGRLPTPDAVAEVLRAAGLTDVQAHLTPLTYTVADVQARWADIRAGLEGEVLRQLPPPEAAALSAAHRAELAPLFLAGALGVPLPVIVAAGRVPPSGG